MYFMRLMKQWDNSSQVYKGQPNTLAMRIGTNAFISKDNKGVDFFLVMALFSFVAWIRLFLTMSNTKIAGPTLRILKSMAIQLVNFFVVWGLMLVMFTMIALTYFSKLQEYRTFYGTFMTLLQYSFGVYDLTIYEGFKKSEFEKNKQKYG